MAQHNQEKVAPAISERPLDEHDLINASGHVQELDRRFGILSVIGVSIQIDNVQTSPLHLMPLVFQLEY